MAIINFPVLYAPNPTLGRPLGLGQLFVGEPGTDPEIIGNQKQLSIVQSDETTIPVDQPLILSGGGVPVYNGSTVRLDVDGNYSLKILDRNGDQQYYFQNVLEGAPLTTESVTDITVATFADAQAFVSVTYPNIKKLFTAGHTDTGVGAASYSIDENQTAPTVESEIKFTDASGLIWSLDNDGDFPAEQFGAIPGTTIDSSAPIQNALDLVPLGSTVTVGNVQEQEPEYRCDTVIIVNERKNLKLVSGRMSRLSAFSTSDDPVVQLRGDFASFNGNGPQTWLVSENESPKGVFGVGVNNPTTEFIAARYFFGGNVSILASTTATSGRGLAFLSSQNFNPLGGALYDGNFNNIWTFNCTDCIYFNPESNGHIVTNTQHANVRGNVINFDGDASGLVTDNTIQGVFVDASATEYGATIRGRNCTHNVLSGINGEPGDPSGQFFDMDDTCDRIVVVGADNITNFGTFDATASGFLINGQFFHRGSDDVVELDDGALNATGLIQTQGDNATIRIGLSIDEQDGSNTSITPVSGGLTFMPDLTTASGIVNSQTTFMKNTTGGGTVTHDVRVEGQLISEEQVLPAVDATTDVGAPTLRYTDAYFVNNPTTGSDERLKKDITEIPQGILDMIINIPFKLYRLIDNESERYHVGIIINDELISEFNQHMHHDELAVFCNKFFEKKEEESGDDRWMVRYTEYQNLMLEAMRRKIAAM